MQGSSISTTTTSDATRGLLLGLAALTMITGANTFMQMNTDAGMRGRVMALYLMVFMGGTPLGSPLIGWVGEVFGARWTLIVGGLVTIGGVLVASAIYLRTGHHHVVVWEGRRDRKQAQTRDFAPVSGGR